MTCFSLYQCFKVVTILNCDLTFNKSQLVNCIEIKITNITVLITYYVFQVLYARFFANYIPFALFFLMTLKCRWYFPHFLHFLQKKLSSHRKVEWLC